MAPSNKEQLPQTDFNPQGCPRTIGPLGEEGKGGQGEVYLCEWSDGTKGVFKVMKDEPNKNRGRHLYQNLSHPNVIKIVDVRNATPEKYGNDRVKCYSKRLVKNVEEKIKEEGPLPQGQIKKLMTDTLNAVEYLHQNDIIHRDLKPRNTMVDEGGSFLIIDQDSSRRPGDLNGPGVTYRDTAPEYYTGDVQNGDKFDAFGLGMTYAKAALGDKFGTEIPVTLQEKLAQVEHIKSQLNKADISETCHKQILELLEVNVEDRASVAEARFMNNLNDETKTIPVKVHRTKAVQKADLKAKQQQTYTIAGGVATVAGGLIKKAATGEKVDVKQDVAKPLAKTSIRVGQTECERQLRTIIKSNDFTKKVGFKSKAGIAAGGAIACETINQLFFENDRDQTSGWEKSKRVGKETAYGVAEYGLNYGGAKLVKTALTGGVEKVATYGAGKGISTGTALLTKAGGSTVSKVVSSSAFGAVSFAAGLAVDGVRILASDAENKGEAFKTAAKTNLAAIAGQAVGAAIGSLAGPVGTVVGGIFGAALGSFVASWF